MSETKYDSVLVGNTSDAVVENGEFKYVNIGFRDSDLKEILDKYVNDRGWVNLTVFRSKNGNTITRCTDPTSDAYKEKQMAKANSNAGQGGGQGDDLPF